MSCKYFGRVVCPLQRVLIANIDKWNAACLGEVGRCIVLIGESLLISSRRLQSSIATRTIWLVSSCFNRDKINVLTGVRTLVKSKGWRIRIHIGRRRRCLVELAKGAKAAQRYHNGPTFSRTIWAIFCAHIEEFWLTAWSNQRWW